MGYAARPETLLTPEYGCRGSQRVKREICMIPNIKK